VKAGVKEAEISCGAYCFVTGSQVHHCVPFFNQGPTFDVGAVSPMKMKLVPEGERIFILLIISVNMSLGVP
jgi:hypothetical protein